MRWIARLLLLMVATVFSGTAASAQVRIALVIGNSKYQNVSFLPNPTNDSADMAAALKRLGFDVRTLTDARYEDMRRALLEFDRRATGSDVAVVFFAGHGMEVGGQNWLIPVDAELSTDTATENEALSLRTVIEKVGKARQLGLVILDACRNNPFAARMEMSTYKRAVDRGFGRVEPSGNVLVAYAAKDGTTANDGSGRNSPFTAALLKNMETPNVEIEMMFRLVRDDVIQATKGGQQPFKYGSLSGQAIYLKRTTQEGISPAASAPPADPAAQAWAALQNTTSVAVLEEFVRRYGDSFYATLATAKLSELKKNQAALNLPPPPSAAPTAAPCAGGVMSASLSAGAPCALSEAQERSLKAADVFRECDACPEMIVVPPGSFTMRDWKKQVTIGRPFAVAKLRVTVAQFAAFQSETGYVVYNQSTRLGGAACTPESFAPGATVGCINWSDAQSYLDWLAKKTGKPYRMLSEAEFVYATLTEASTRFFDSASEWVEDCAHPYHPTFAGVPTDGSVWAGGDCGYHMTGSRSQYSSSTASVRREGSLGFRVARTLAR